MKIYSIKESNEIVILKKKNEYRISKKNILESYHVKAGSFNLMYSQVWWYEYILIKLKNNKKFYITNLLSKPEKIERHLKIYPKELNPVIPFIDKGIGTGNLYSKSSSSQY